MIRMLKNDLYSEINKKGLALNARPLILTVRQRGLAVVDVGDDGEIANLGHYLWAQMWRCLEVY